MNIQKVKQAHGYGSNCKNCYFYRANTSSCKKPSTDLKCIDKEGFYIFVEVDKSA